MEKDSEEAKWQRKERVTFTLFSPSAAAASSAIFQVDGFALASEIGVVGRLKSMDILLMPFHLCWELFWRKLSQEHLRGPVKNVLADFVR